MRLRYDGEKEPRVLPDLVSLALVARAVDVKRQSHLVLAGTGRRIALLGACDAVPLLYRWSQRVKPRSPSPTIGRGRNGLPDSGIP